MALRRSTGFLNKIGGIKTNLITNGTFETNTTGWTADNAILTVDGGWLQVATDGGGTLKGAAYVDIATVPGRIYRMDLDVRVGTAAGCQVLVGSSADPDGVLASPVYTNSAGETKTLLFLAAGDTTRISLVSDDVTNATTAFFDNVKVEEIIDGFQELFRGCKINVYSGSQPASANDAATGTLLYTLTLDGDGSTGLSWEQAVNGVIAKKASESWRGTAVASGIAGWFRVYEYGDNPAQSSTLKARWDGAVATSGAEANMSNTSVEAGAVQTATAFTYTQPSGA